MNEAITLMDQNIVAVVNTQISRIADIVKAHGGGVEIIKATADELVIALKGHCAGCPMAPLTFGVVLNKYLKEALPNLKKIQYVEMK